MQPLHSVEGNTRYVTFRSKPWEMAQNAHRVNVTLEPAYALTLQRLAERTHTNEGTLARSLLSTALDEADPDPRNIADLFDALPGAFDRAQLGASQAKAGLGTPLDEL